MEDVTATEIPDEQTMNEESMLRPISLANVFKANQGRSNEEESAIWDQYRGAGAIDESDNVADDSLPLPKANKSIVSTFASNMNNHCFTLKGYEDELKKARNEIFGLKLRIRLLEESQGLAERPDDKENVYRVNLDLRVEKEVLKQQVEEKIAQLQEAYFAVDQLEREREEEKQELLAKIEELSSRPQDFPSPPPPPLEDAVSRPSLLTEAFGSMDLGTHPDDNAAVVEELKEKISNLEGDLEVEKDHGEDMKKLLETRDSQIKELMEHEEKLTLDLERLEETIKAKNERIEALEQQAKDQAEKLILEAEAGQEKEAVAAHFQDTISSLEAQIRALKGQLEMDQKSWQARLDHELADLQDALAASQEALEEESATSRDQQTYLNLKLTEIANLMGQVKSQESQIQELSQELSSTKENLIKTQLCLDGLTEVTMEQKLSHLQLEKELKQKTLINDRLVKEYEIAKAKVRKYRSERTTFSCTSQSDIENNGSNFSKRENEAAKMAYLRQGADKALAKARDVYTQEIQRLDMSHNAAMKLMRKRLEELADCLEQILNNGLLDWSIMSESVREALQQSLDESRTIFNDTTEEFREKLLPVVNVTLDDLELELGPMEDFENLVNELKLEHAGEVQALKAEIEKLHVEISEKSSMAADLKELKEKSDFVIAEKNSIIEDLRVKHGSSREKLKKLEDENAKLRDKTKTLKEMSKLQTDLEKLQKEAEAKEASLKLYMEANDKLMSCKAANENELEDLRAQLDKANAKLNEYRERQEKVNNTLRIQLAKTHTVLKRTKNQMKDVLLDSSNKEN